MSNKAVANKIIEAWKLIGSIEKKGRNPKFNYAFVREEDAADALRHAFIKVGLACVPSVEKLERSIIKTSSGGEMQHVIITMKFTLTDKDTGETDSFIMVGEAADSFDKAVYKAITGCTKYAYVKLAMSGAEDNEDEDTGERVGEQGKQQHQEPKPIPQGATYRKPEHSTQPAGKPNNSAGNAKEQSENQAENKPAPKPAEKPVGNSNPASAPPTQAPASAAQGQQPTQAQQGGEIPIMEDVGLITAVIPSMKGKPATISFKSETSSTVIPLTFDPKVINVPELLKLQSAKAKVKVSCDISSGAPHLMHIQGV